MIHHNHAEPLYPFRKFLSRLVKRDQPLVTCVYLHDLWLCQCYKLRMYACFVLISCAKRDT